MSGNKDSDREQWCHEAIERNGVAWADFKDGDEGALNYLVGQVMALSEGRADPGKVADEFRSLRTDSDREDA